MQLPDRIIVYELSGDDPTDMRYRVKVREGEFGVWGAMGVGSYGGGGSLGPYDFIIFKQD